MGTVTKEDLEREIKGLKDLIESDMIHIKNHNETIERLKKDLEYHKSWHNHKQQIEHINEEIRRNKKYIAEYKERIKNYKTRIAAKKERLKFKKEEMKKSK